MYPFKHNYTTLFSTFSFHPKHETLSYLRSNCIQLCEVILSCIFFSLKHFYFFRSTSFIHRGNYFTIFSPCFLHQRDAIDARRLPPEATEEATSISSLTSEFRSLATQEALNRVSRHSEHFQT